MQRIEHLGTQGSASAHHVFDVAQKPRNFVTNRKVSEAGDLYKRLLESGLFSGLTKQVGNLAPVNVIAQGQLARYQCAAGANHTHRMAYEIEIGQRNQITIFGLNFCV